MVHKDLFKTETPCRCGCGMDVHPDVSWILNTIRRMLGYPLYCTSGARCKTHNTKSKGVPNSAHTTGLAADVAFKDNKQKFEIVKALMSLGVTRIGINDKHEFIHFDIDESKPNPSLFSY